MKEINKKHLTPESNAKNQKELVAENKEKVKGIFHFFEVPGGTLKFFYAVGTAQPERFTLRDGEMCEIPLGVARHLNKSGSYPVHAYRQDEAGNTHRYVGKRVRRFGFQSLDFVDVEDLTLNNEPFITEPGYMRKI